MLIAVASGKGGTGKTTVATNLALTIGKDVQFLDCDVDEPDAHLFLRPEIERSEVVKVPVPEVDENLCNLCGKCQEICQFKAIVLIADRVLTFHELCHSCGGCFEVCPQRAISEGDRELGIIEEGFADGIRFVHGRLRIGEAMDGPLIREVRKRADDSSITIIAAPPGSSCPVVEAIKGVDFVLLVTEPTPFGLFDLKIVHRVVEILGIPCALVINRADVGDSGVKEYAKEKEIPILLEIPFDRRILELYSEGTALVSAMDSWKERFEELFGKIKKILQGEGNGK